MSRSTACVERLEKHLARDERVRADRFHSDKVRQNFIVCRGLLRAVLGHYLNLAPREVRFRYGAQGKPFLDHEFDPGLNFNASHSNELVAFGVSCGRRIGIDVEYVRPLDDAERLARRFFSEREYAEYDSLPRHQRQEAFFACWTRKEAYVKAHGEGLTTMLGSFDVSVAPDRPAAILSVRNNQDDAARWSLESIHIGDGYVGTLAVEIPVAA